MTRRLLLIGAVLFAGGCGASAAPLTLTEARRLALEANPGITVARLHALVARELTTEAGAGALPQVTAGATALGTGETLTRLSTNPLSNSQLYDHVGAGAALSQLLTDFGRTSHLTSAARQRTAAADAGVAAARAQLLLAVDSAYFSALEARAVRGVAEKTLANRQLLLDRMEALQRQDLRSELDVRFARVAVTEAQLLANRADGDWHAALATLSSLLGQRPLLQGDLAEELPGAETLPADPEPLAAQALQQRPELQAQRFERDAQHDLAAAARAARLPTISAVGAVGVTPVGDEHFDSHYAAGAINVTVPLFAGGLYRARQHEAELQAQSAEAALAEQENEVVRDVRVAWFDAVQAHERIALTAGLLENAAAALDLARARVERGLSSVVELNQAELVQLSAEIAHANAVYDFRVRQDILDFRTGNLR